jgi:sodium-dependent phosphate transporter
MMVVWKGAPSLHLDALSTGAIVGAIFGVMGVTVLITLLVFYPFLYRRLVMEDWTLRWYHIFYGPFLWRRGPVPWCPEEQRIVVQNYYRGHLTKEELDARDASLTLYREATELGEQMSPKSPKFSSTVPSSSTGTPATSPTSITTLPNLVTATKKRPTKQYDKSFINWCRYIAWPSVRGWILHGVDQDVIQLQQRNSRHSRTKRIEKMHSRAAHYDNQTSTQSFAHGSNDVANAIGPLATIFLVWQTNSISTTVPVPVWVLAFGGMAIVLGFATWGYNVMQNLGNRLTLHSPSRGFSMELGSALTVLLASRLGLPVSTAQCIVGATIAVGLCNGNWKAMNWRMAVWIFGGWILTVPVTAVMAGCIMGFVINAPKWNG